MKNMIMFTILLLFGFVFADEPAIKGIKPCASNEITCLQQTCTTFLNEVAGGAGEPANIPAFDPYEIASMDIPSCCLDGVLHFKNIKVRGLRYANLTTLNLDKTKKVVDFTMDVDLTTTADIAIEEKDKSRTLTGTIEMKAKHLVSSHYDYEVKVDDTGIERFVIKPETTKCEVLAVPEVTLNPELQQALNNDPDVQAKLKEKADKATETRKTFACKILNEVFPSILNSFRRLTLVMSMSEYFADKV